MLCIFFFFKQKTAYEMRISDWSSDVCSSDLIDRYEAAGPLTARLEAALHDLDFGGGPAGALLGREVRLTAGLDGDLPRLLRLEKLTRSEEHTAELQSLMRRSYAVYCLKKTNYVRTSTIVEYEITKQMNIAHLS